MAKIYIRGHQVPQTVDVKTAKMVDEIKNDKTKDDKYYIRLDGFSCDKGDVKSVVIFDNDDDKSQRNSEKQDENGERLRKYQKDFEDEIRSYVQGNLEKKLQFNLKIAKMYCFAITGKEEIEEYKLELKPIFIEELKTNKLVVNPSKYIKLFTVNEVNGSKDLTKIDYIIRGAPFRIMNNYLQEVYELTR